MVTAPIPTGLTSLDNILGGGMPRGLIHIHGEIEQIQRVRNQMLLTPGGKTYLMVGSPPPLQVFVGHVASQLHAASSAVYKDGIIFDTGDVTHVLEREPEAGATVELLQKYVVSVVKPTCVVMETHSNYTLFQRVADVVLYADPQKKAWRIEKGPVNEGAWFDPLWDEAPPEPTPRSVSAQRVINALRKDPKLAWEVTQDIRLLSMWQNTGGGWHRRSPNGNIGARIWLQVPGDLSTAHLLIFEGGEVNVPLTASNMNALMSEADEVLRARDFLLFDGDPT